MKIALTTVASIILAVLGFMYFRPIVVAYFHEQAFENQERQRTEETQKLQQIQVQKLQQIEDQKLQRIQDQKLQDQQRKFDEQQLQHSRDLDELQKLQNRTQIKTYALLPSQRFTVINSDFGDMELISEFPVTVIFGDCQANYTVQWHCSGNPHDLIVIDTRRVPVFATPKANIVRVKMR